MTKMEKMIRIQGVTVAALLIATTLPASAQRTSSPAPRVDFAVTYTADRTNPVNGPNQWLMGGSAELGANVWHGFGASAVVTGVTTDSIGSQGVPLHLVITTFGPRYRFGGGRWSFYGEGLIGEANGFKGAYPANGHLEAGANAFAIQAGGGADFYLGRHFGIRALQANWTRTQFPNGTSNVQNHLLLGAGLVLRF